MRLPDGTTLPAPTRAITLHRWWAHAVAWLGKDIENRTWKPPTMLGSRFWIAIHAGAPRSKFAEDLDRAGVREMLDRAGKSGQVIAPLGSISSSGVWAPRHSAIVAVAEVDRIYTPQQDGGPWHVDGQFGWHLGRVYRLANPIACSGLQKVWKLKVGTWDRLESSELIKVERDAIVGGPLVAK